MEEQKDCIFCKMSSGEIEVERIMETDNFFVIKDRYPNSKGHSLIISKKHYENLLHFPSLLGNELIALTKDLYIKLSKEFDSEGFNLIQNNFKAAGQVIPHLHFHILPRKQNDGVKLN
jgi:histidine triad (HIT) family protein